MKVNLYFKKSFYWWFMSLKVFLYGSIESVLLINILSHCSHYSFFSSTCFVLSRSSCVYAVYAIQQPSAIISTWTLVSWFHTVRTIYCFKTCRALSYKTIFVNIFINFHFFVLFNFAVMRNKLDVERRKENSMKFEEDCLGSDGLIKRLTPRVARELQLKP